MRSETWVAPGRVNVIGEHTDYNGGFVLPVAVDRHTTVKATPRADDELRCRSVQFPNDDSWTVYVRAVARALADTGRTIGGADVDVDSTVPPGAGLSSSAALEVATAGALAALAGAPLEPDEAIAVTHRAENTYVGVPSGVMDQTASVKGRAGHAVFLDCRSLEAELVAFDLDTHDLALVVADSGVRRRLAEGRYAERRRQCEQAAAALGVEQLRDATLDDVEISDLDDVLRRRARHVVTEDARVLDTVEHLRAGRIEDIGPLLLASHASLRDDFEVSVPELDAIVDSAMAAGALGARMTGGGFGGAAIVLVPAARLDSVLQRFGEAAFVVRPSDGFRRVEELR